MSKRIELSDELTGFHPGSEGSQVVVYRLDQTVGIATRYVEDFEDDEDGWNWGLGTTRLNRKQIVQLRDFLNEQLEEIK